MNFGVLSYSGFNSFTLTRISLTGQCPRHGAIFVPFQITRTETQRRVVFITPDVIIVQTGFVGPGFGTVLAQRFLRHGPQLSVSSLSSCTAGVNKIIQFRVHVHLHSLRSGLIWGSSRAIAEVLQCPKKLPYSSPLNPMRKMR